MWANLPRLGAMNLQNVQTAMKHERGSIIWIFTRPWQTIQHTVQSLMTLALQITLWLPYRRNHNGLLWKTAKYNFLCFSASDGKLQRVTWERIMHCISLGFRHRVVSASKGRLSLTTFSLTTHWQCFGSAFYTAALYVCETYNNSRNMNGLIWKQTFIHIYNNR